MKYVICYVLICLCANALSSQVNLNSCSLNLQCGGQSQTGDTPNQGPPITCKDVSPRSRGETGGVFAIYPFAGWRSSVLAYCDHVTDNGGWIVFQRRIDGSEDFYRNWNEYVNGFGNLNGEFWMGLENLHLITSNGEYELRIDMEDFQGDKRHAIYSNFTVGPGSDYILSIGDYSGSAGDSLGYVNGAKFTTKDKDQDTIGDNCAVVYRGAGWYTDCHLANPNGFYHGGEHTTFADGVNWKTFRGYNYSLKVMEMKMRLK